MGLLVNGTNRRRERHAVLGDTKMLVVDDEEVICHSCRRLFSRQGLRVETSSDALEGLRMAIRNDYAVILLDIEMPVLDGIQLLQALRKTKPDVPVILVTGNPSMQARAVAARLGAVDCLSKPFTPEEITQAVQKLVHHPGMKVQAGSEALPPAGGAPSCVSAASSLSNSGDMSTSALESRPHTKDRPDSARRGNCTRRSRYV